jgi:hypothetical protein
MEDDISAGIFKQSMGARNRVGIGLSYRPARLHRLWERFLKIDSLAPQTFKNTGSAVDFISLGFYFVVLDMYVHTVHIREKLS